MRTIRHTAVMTAVLLLAACQSTTVQTESRITLPAAFSQAQAVGEIQNLARWWQNWRVTYGKEGPPCLRLSSLSVPAPARAWN